MITSARNSKVQMVRALNANPKARREASAFVVEGVRLLEESIAHGWLPKLVLFSEAISERGLRLIRLYQEQGIEVEQAAPHVLKAAGDTETPPGLLAVLPLKQLPLPSEPGFILVLDGIRDPGNLGTILRTAAAAGVEAVLLAPGSVDPFSPKVLRSGMGAHFHLPVRPMAWDEIQSYLRQVGGKVFLADAGGGTAYTDTDMIPPVALIVGGEAYGAGEQAQSLAHERVIIPMAGEVESLNAAVAAGILLFEVLRQKRS